jgi:protein involved in temperature-dependent protein secretion
MVTSVLDTKLFNDATMKVRGNVTCDILLDMEALQVKLRLLNKHITDQNLSYFTSYKIIFQLFIVTGDWQTPKNN